MKRVSIIAIAIAITILLTGAYFFVGNYFYDLAVNANTTKEFLDNDPNLESSDLINKEREAAEKLADDEFLKQYPSMDKSITSSDKHNLNLHAEIFQNKESNSKWAIIVHGYAGDIQTTTRWIRNFHEKGYNVLAPDLRGHGKSEGEYIGMGWDDRLDIVSWIDEVIKMNPDAEIVLSGVSMGGATVMNTAGENLPDNVKVIVEDCGFVSTSDIFAYQLNELFSLPRFPILNAANTITKIRAGYDIFQSPTLNQIANSKTPMLFIHGDQDKFVPFEMLDKAYNAATVEKEKLVIPGAGHGESLKINSELYWETVWGFVDEYIH